ncbi:MAG TPA: hypothetical protein VGF95_00345 [Solirubrobacteraceae bacterium]|jgi:hypothetical protein
MRHRNLTISMLGAAALALAAQAAPAAASGLSVSPSILEHSAHAGGVGSVTITNTTSGTLKINVKARPWVQSLSGAVAPSQSKELSGMRLSRTSFSLGAGAQSTVSLKLVGKPSDGSLFGCLEVRGTPTRHSKHGITVAYRLISTLRLNPSRKTLKAQVEGLGVVGKSSHSTLALTIRNRGNTVDPIGGTVRLTGPRGTLTDTVTSTRIIPGGRVRVTLQSLRKVPGGSYSASVSLTQDGRTVTRASRRIRLP